MAQNESNIEVVEIELPDKGSPSERTAFPKKGASSNRAEAECHQESMPTQTTAANRASSQKAASAKEPMSARTASTTRAPEATSEATRKSMKGNKRANTKPELLVRQRLRAAGLTGYRLQWKVPGKPDIAWPGKKVAIFVNGCFWHRCPYCNLPIPKSHTEYWIVKFDRNQERDARNTRTLEEAGWKVHVIWECQLKKKAIDTTFKELLPILAEELGKELSV